MTSILAKNIFDQLFDAKLTMTLIEPDRLSVSPSERLNDHLRALIRTNKAELLASLIAANEPNIKQPDTCTAAALDDGNDLPPEPLPSQDNIIKDNNKLPPRKLGHFHVDAPWRVLSREYYQHHFNCPQCICAGRGARYDVRCDIGAALWKNYSERDRNENP